MAPHLDPGEGSLGIHVDVSHSAATPPGMTVTVDCECTVVDGKRIACSRSKPMTASMLIGEGRHERFVVALRTSSTRSQSPTKAAKAEGSA